MLAPISTKYIYIIYIRFHLLEFQHQQIKQLRSSPAQINNKLSSLLNHLVLKKSQGIFKTHISIILCVLAVFGVFLPWGHPPYDHLLGMVLVRSPKS